MGCGTASFSSPPAIPDVTTRTWPSPASSTASPSTAGRRYQLLRRPGGRPRSSQPSGSHDRGETGSYGPTGVVDDDMVGRPYVLNANMRLKGGTSDHPARGLSTLSTSESVRRILGCRFGSRRSRGKRSTSGSKLRVVDRTYRSKLLRALALATDERQSWIMWLSQAPSTPRSPPTAISPNPPDVPR
jgi:hypothetical protein